MTREIDLSAGTIDYEDTGGDGPVVVLLHGLMMDATLWDGVVAELSADHRCVVPTCRWAPTATRCRTTPTCRYRGSPGWWRSSSMPRPDRRHPRRQRHRRRPRAAAHRRRAPARVGRIVLVSCDAFDNFPPGLTGKTVVATGKLPPALFGLFMQQMRMRALQAAADRLRLADQARRRHHRRLDQAGPRAAAHPPRRGAGAARHRGNRDLLVDAAERVPGFDRPALVVWASEDRVMPPEHGRRLAELFPHARLVEVHDSHTLIPLDQPAALIEVIREFSPLHVAGAAEGRSERYEVHACGRPLG